MSYFDHALTQRLKNALADLGIQSNDYPSLVQIYYTIRVLRQYLPPVPEITTVQFGDVLNSDPIMMALAVFGIQPFASARCAKLHILYNLVCGNGLESDHVRFFRLVAPALVADWVGFSAKFTDGNNWETMLAVLYHISLRVYRVSGTNAVFDEHPRKVAEDIINAELLDDYDVEFLADGVRHTLYIELAPLAHQLDERYTKKLSAAINRITAMCDECGEITAHDCILQFIMQGNLTSHAALNKELQRLQKVQASDVVFLFRCCTKQDDILVLRLVLARFFEISVTGEMLIYNPSPTMLVEYQYVGGVPEKTIFVVPDALEAQAYRRQFPRYRFYAADTLPASFRGNVLILDDDGSLTDERLSQLFEICTSENSQLLIYAPQTEVSHINKLMAESGLYIDAIIGMPTGIAQSVPAKKTLIFGSSDDCEVVRVMQVERNVQLGRGKTGLPFLPVNALYLSRKYVEIPGKWICQNLMIPQMINMRKDAEIDHLAKYQKAREYAWSREITIFYVIYPRDNGNLEGRAYVKSIALLKGKIHYGKKVGESRSRGLRGKSVDAILEKLPCILFEQDLYEAYVPVLRKLHDESPQGLSLKTIWYMLWADLQSMTSYNDSICHELFCSECQELSNINPATATVETILDALELVCGMREIPEAYLKQLCLIFRMAVDCKYLSENKFKNVLTRVRTQKTEMENIVSRLRKRTATDAEIKRILMMLMEVNEGFPGYASSSKYLFSAISLFAPVSLVHLRALKWGDIVLEPDLCVIEIARKITRDGRVIAIDPPYPIPCSPIIMMLCLDRLGYLASKCGISAQMIKDEPVFWESDPCSKSDLKHKLDPISHATAKTLQKEMLAVANIQTAFMQVTDGDKSQIINLNDTYLRTFWHDNVVTQAALRGLERGEVSYLLGKTPVDTVDAHYYGFEAPYNLMRMAAIQHRWTAPYEALLRPVVDGSEEKVITVNADVDLHSRRDLGKRSFLYFEICYEKKEGDVQLEIDSQFGHSASITQIGE